MNQSALTSVLPPESALEQSFLSLGNSMSPPPEEQGIEIHLVHGGNPTPTTPGVYYLILSPEESDLFLRRYFEKHQIEDQK